MSNSVDGIEPPSVRETGAIAVLAMLAATELAAFERFSAATANAPTVADKAELGELAHGRLTQFERTRERLVELGVEPETAVAAQLGSIEEFHGRTRPRDWYEDLMKAYIADGMVADFFRELAGLLDDRTRSFVLSVLADTRLATFARKRIFAAAGADSRLAGRLALWGRRLVGEAMSQAQLVFAEDPAFAALLADRPAGADGAADGVGPEQPRPPASGRILVAMTESHARRMAALGMSA